MITIVAAGPDDATEILAIQLRAFEAEARLVDNRDIPPMTETIESVIDQIELTRVLKAVDGQRILGSIRGVMSDNVCTIQRLSIALDCQGLGLG